MITCLKDEPHEGEHRYVERRNDEWSMVHGGERKWVTDRKARTYAEKATLLIYKYEESVNINSNLMSIVTDGEERDRETTTEIQWTQLQRIRPRSTHQQQYSPNPPA